MRIVYQCIEEGVFHFLGQKTPADMLVVQLHCQVYLHKTLPQKNIVTACDLFNPEQNHHSTASTIIQVSRHL